MEIITKGRTVKISGLPIIRVPKGKIAVITGFHITEYVDTETYKIEKHGEVLFVPKEDEQYEFLIRIEHCKFDEKNRN